MDQRVFERELGEKIGSIKMYRERRDRGFNRPPREMHTVTCADCGQEAQVPFKPDGTRPVYCQECYRKHRPPRRF